MPSPFPGMNPYLEQDDVWQDFHDSFIPAVRDILSPQVSPQFMVKIARRFLTHEPSAARFDKEVYLEIRDRLKRQLITVLDLLSPANKRPGPNREQYLAKRANLLRSAAHLVEIDLLRGGPQVQREMLPECDYCLMVSRAVDRPRAHLWPLGLRDRLPVVPIPLQPPWPDAQLDLQAVLHAVYDRAYYKDYIYDGVPQPPLLATDAVWAEALLRPPGSTETTENAS